MSSLKSYPRLSTLLKINQVQAAVVSTSVSVPFNSIEDQHNTVVNLAPAPGNTFNSIEDQPENLLALTCFKMSIFQLY